MAANEVHSKCLSGGHEETVLCIDTSKDGTIVTGGEEGEVCVWDSTGTLIAKHQYPEGDVSSICISRLHPDRIFLACGTDILVVEQRNFKEPKKTLQFNTEDINQIALNEKEDFLAACDDSGLVKIINIHNSCVQKTLRKHSNICATVCFRPKITKDLLSGGLDCNFIHWDFTRGRCSRIINMNELQEDQEAPTTYMFNPPFVHSISVSSNNKYIACGVENGAIQLFDNSRRYIEHLCHLKHHTKGVSQVHFSRDAPFTLVSGGNDGKVLIWDMEESSAGNEEREEPLGVTLGRKEPKEEIDHGSPVNYLTSMLVDCKLVVLVADTTSKVTMYHVDIGLCDEVAER